MIYKNVGPCDPVGPKGRIGFCPVCGSINCSYDVYTDSNKCNECGWTELSDDITKITVENKNIIKRKE